MRAVFLDLETTGLVAAKDAILEIGVIVVEVPTLKEVGRWTETLRAAPEQLARMVPKVVEMHNQSGLLDAVAKATRTAAEAESELAIWLSNMTGGVPCYLAGSNPDFDRRFLEEYMPNVARRLHYRNFDVNTFFILREWIAGKEKHGTAHRAIADCEQAICGVRSFLNWMASVFRPTPKTQLDRVLAALRDQKWSEMALILGEAQNGPPEGAADGSIPALLWTALREACKTALMKVGL